MPAQKLHKSLFISLAVLLSLVFLVACGSSGPATGGDGPQTLTMLTWDQGNGLGPYNQAIAAFEKIHPNVKINLQSDTSTYYETKLLTELANGTAPDIFLVSDDEASELAHSGQLEDITGLVNNHTYGINSANFFPRVWQTGKFDGKYYYIPKDWADASVLYNKTLFKKAGLAYPQSGWTLQQFIQDAEKLTISQNGRTSQWGVQLPGTWLRPGLEYMESAYGAQMISPDGKTVDGYLNTPQSEQAIQAYIDLYTKDHISPSINQMNGFGNLDLFMTGRVAMEWTGPWNVGEYLKDPNLDFGVAPMPVGPTGKPVTQMFWAGWAVSAKAQHLQTSEELLGFFASQQWAQIDSYWGMPALQGPAANALQQREGAMRTYFSQVDDLQPIISLNTINWVKDCQPPLQDLIENMTEKPGLNLQQQVPQVVGQIDNNLTSTFQDQGS